MDEKVNRRLWGWTTRTKMRSGGKMAKMREYKDHEESELVAWCGRHNNAKQYHIDGPETSESIIKNKVEGSKARYMVLQECCTESLKTSMMDYACNMTNTAGGQASLFVIVACHDEISDARSENSRNRSRIDIGSQWARNDSVQMKRRWNRKKRLSKEKTCQICCKIICNSKRYVYSHTTNF